jgi:hypothetical protein
VILTCICGGRVQYSPILKSQFLILSGSRVVSVDVVANRLKTIQCARWMPIIGLSPSKYVSPCKPVSSYEVNNITPCSLYRAPEYSDVFNIVASEVGASTFYSQLGIRRYNVIMLTQASSLCVLSVA